MSLKIVNTEEDKTPELKPIGGTELMWNALMERTEPENWENVNLILSKMKDVNPDKKNILWLHDLAQDPEYNNLKDEIDQFEKFIFVSNWQQHFFQYTHNIPWNKSVVIRNAIEPIEEHEKPRAEKTRFIYTSTPHRGLAVLFKAVELLSKYRTDFEVDVYSSFNIYGWTEKQEESQHFFDKISEHPQINYHGTQSNSIVREALKESHIFAYPSIYQETYCLSMIEAMSAGCLCLVPNLGALPEIGASFPAMYHYEDDMMEHAALFAGIMNQSIDVFWQPGIQQKLMMQRHHTNANHSWDVRIHEWRVFLDELKGENK